MKKSCSINKVSIDAHKLTVVGIHREAFSVWQWNSPEHQVLEVLLRTDDPVITYFPAVFLLVFCVASQINNQGWLRGET